MSEESLVVDGDAIAALAGPVSTSGYGLPDNVQFDFSGSCSSSVTAAAESFSMWASVHVALAAGQLTDAAQTADDIVATWSTTDQALSTGGEG